MQSENTQRRDVLLNLNHTRSKTLLLAVGVFIALVLSLGVEAAVVPQREWSNIGWYWCQWRASSEQEQWEYWCWSEYYGYWWRVQ